MSNANRDYAIVYDVKNSLLALSRPLVFYITDKNTSNIFVRLVTRISIEDGIDQYTNIENATNYALTMRVIKPNNEIKSIQATQHELESIFQFDLTEDFKDIPGKYICELIISTIVSGRQELITSDPFNYEVKRSILSNVGEIIETEDTTVEKLLNDLDATKADLSSQIKEKANDNEVRKKSHPITLSDLSSDVKTAMTGGSVAVVGKDTIGNENIKYKSISKNKLNFAVKCGNNLFDMDDINREGYISGNGNFVASNTYFDSGFISVEPNTNYCSNINSYHVAFDIDKNFIGSITKNNYLFTTPDNCYFIKVACPKDKLNEFMINKGDVLLPYEKCVYKDKSLLIEFNDVKGIDEIQLTENNCTFLTKKVGENLFDKSKVISNKYYSALNGALISYNGYNASDYIEVEEGVKYSWNCVGHICYLDKDKKFVDGSTGITTKVIPTDIGIKYITFSVPTNVLDTTMFVKGDLPSTYIPYKEYYQLNDNIVIQNTEHKLSGLKWNVLGDSITSINYANKRYWEYISDEIGIKVNNYGISGSRIAVWEGHNQPMCIRYANMTDDADIITVFAGTNDFGNSVTLGDITSTDTGTFYGALNVLCKGLIEKYPGKRIGFITPIQRYGVPFDDNKWQSYQNAIKEVCGKYSIPVLDGTKEVGLAISSVSSIKDRYTIDGLHLNDDGHKIFARRVLSFIESL